MALATAPVALRAQDADPAPEDSGVIGPRELENFSINGTVTQPAPERPAPNQPASRPPAPGPASATFAAPRDRPAPAPGEAPASAQNNRLTPTPSGADAVVSDTRTPLAARPDPMAGQGSSVTVALPPMAGDAAQPDPTFEPSTAPGNGPSLLPWLLAAFALALGALLLWWQKRAQPAFAGGAEVQAFAAPEPALQPARPRAPPPPTIPAKAPEAAPDPFAGLVSTRLRPWVDLSFEPARCSVEDDKVVIDFEIEMMNRGNAPARAVLIEARMVNAGPSQDAEIGQFFSNPVGQGDRIDTIAPLSRVRIKSQIVAPRDQVQIYDVGGRKVFVPLVAFNVLYSWSRGMGQTSLSFLVGRDTKSDKMAPFRLDMGPRLFRGLGKQPLPLEVRQ
ncbi:MAG: hypothetical protein ABIS23_04940 [Sphingomicrobium sp.]